MKESVDLESSVHFSTAICNSNDENRLPTSSIIMEDSFCGLAPATAVNASKNSIDCDNKEINRTSRSGIRSLRAAYNIADNEYRVC